MIIRLVGIQVAVMLCLLGYTQDNRKIKFTRFALEHGITLVKTIKPELPTGSNIFRMYISDSVIVLMNNRATDNFFYYAFSLRSKKIAGTYMAQGAGKFKVLNTFSDGILNDGSVLWGHDITTKKMLLIPLSKKGEAVDSVKIREYIMPRFFASVTLIDSVTLLCSQSEDTSMSKLQMMDLRTGRVVKEWGSYIGEIPKGMNMMAWKDGNHSYLYTNPDKNKAVLANRYSDQLEIFDLHTSKSKIVQGPYHFDPAFEQIQNGNIFYARFQADARYGYMRGATTNKYIYLLYCGDSNPNDPVSKWMGKSVFVFDWEGNPVKRYNLNKAVRCITVSPDDSMLYAFDIESGYFMESKLF